MLGELFQKASDLLEEGLDEAGKRAARTPWSIATVTAQDVKDDLTP